MPVHLPQIPKNGTKIKIQKKEGDTVIHNKQNWLESYPLMCDAETPEHAGVKPKQTLANRLKAAEERARTQDAHNKSTSPKQTARE